MTRAYSIYEAKAKLSEILRMVKAGKEVLINERGHPIAKILPFESVNSLEDNWQKLLSSGQIQPAKKRLDFIATDKSKGALNRFLNERD